MHSAKYLLFLLLCLLAGAGRTGDLVVERAFLLDPGHAIPFTVARQADFRTTERIAVGFFQGTVWVRVRVDPGASDSARNTLVLRVRPNHLDEIELFDPLSSPNGGVLAGDRVDAPASYTSLDFSFDIPRGDAPRDVWLRVRSTGNVRADVAAFTPEETRVAERGQQLIGAFVLGYQSLLFLWALVILVVYRQRLIAIFAAKQALLIVTTAVLLGYARLLLGPDVPPPVLDVMRAAQGFAFTLTVIAFDYALLREFDPPAHGKTLLKLLAAIDVLGAVLYAAGFEQAGYRCLAIALFSIPWVSTYMAARAKAWSRPGHAAALPRVMLVGAYLAMLGVSLSVLSLLPPLHLVKVDEPVSVGIGLYSVMTGTLMLAMLMLRGLNDRQLQRHLKLQVEMERELRAQQSQFTAMLAHELKSPLGVLRMAVAARPDDPTDEMATTALDDIGNVIDRCVQVSRVADGRVHVRQALCDLSSLLFELRDRQPTARDRVRLDVREECSAWTDRQLLGVVVGNLLDNALKYSPPGSPVEVTLEAQERDGARVACIWVRNSVGPAGRPERGRVFEKYYRAPRASSQTGTGLGLYLVRSVATLLQARVEYDDAHEEHVRFVLSMPAVDETAAAGTATVNV